jgi:hypothetical protein
MSQLYFATLHRHRIADLASFRGISHRRMIFKVGITASTSFLLELTSRRQVHESAAWLVIHQQLNLFEQGRVNPLIMLYIVTRHKGVAGSYGSTNRPFFGGRHKDSFLISVYARLCELLNALRELLMCSRHLE